MTHTTNLSLPYLLPNQAQKHVTHNEALKMLDVLVQLSVVDNTLSAPPQTPSEGDSYTIASSPSGDWETYENQIAIWHDGAWSFYPPNKGWITWVESNNLLQAYNGTDWVDISGVLSANTAPKLGINATADTINRLSVNSAAILFNKEIDDVQVKLNKHASTDNASFLFQTNFSGRAEIGTTGDDDFHFKVSPDGTTWKEGILIDVSTGEVSFPNTTLNISSSADPFDALVTRIFNRISPSQWGFCHVVSEAYTDIAKTTKAIAADDVVAVIEDKSPNDIDLVAGGTDAANKIKLRLDPVTVGVDEAHLTTHFLKVTVPTGGFEGKLIMAYRSGCIIADVEVPAGDWEIWSGHSTAVPSGFIGAFAAENISQFEINEVIKAFHDLGAGSKPLTILGNWYLHADNFYKSLNINGFDFSKVGNLTGLLRNSSLKKLILTGDIFEHVTHPRQLLHSCSSLKSLDATDWDLSKAYDTTYMFYGCSSLKSLDVSNWDLSSVVSMHYMFRNCTSLTFLDISNWDLSSASNMGYAFYNCSSLTSIEVGGAFDNTPCTNFTNTFVGCALDQKTIDDVLIGIEKAGTTNGTLHMTGSNNSAPSSSGVTAKTALVGRGWTVTTQ